MFSNYLTTSLRNLSKHKVYSLINIFGLAVGLTAFILISIYIRYEFGYDRYIKENDQIFRLTTWQQDGDKESHSISTTAALSPVLKQEIPEVSACARIMNVIDNRLAVNNNYYENEICYYTENSFFDVFTNYRLIAGDTKSALSTANSIVLSESTAKRLFGKTNPLGKTLFNQEKELTVTGIFEDIPENTHLPFDALISLETINIKYYEKWNLKISYLATYVKLFSNTDINEFQQKLQSLYLSNYTPSEGSKRELHVQPLKQIHLRSRLEGDSPQSGKLNQLAGFGLIATIILLLACINYINLATARSNRRHREVGIRKVLGAYKKQLFTQFMMESSLLTLIAFVLSLVFVELFFPFFKLLSARDEIISFNADFYHFAGLTLLYIFISFFSGFFPAFILTRYNPVNIIKDTSNRTKRSTRVRDTLVAFQFLVSLGLIFATSVIFYQLKYLGNKDMGFNKNNIVVLNTFDEGDSNELQAFKNEIITDSSIDNVSLSTGVPFVIEPDVISQMKLPENEIQYDGYFIAVDEDFFKTYNFSLLKGRFLSSKYQSDFSSTMLVNESAVRAMDWNNDVIGKQLSLPRAGMQYFRDNEGNIVPFDPDPAPSEIVGIVKDFHYQSLYNKIKPLVIFLDDKDFTVVSIKYKSTASIEALSIIEDAWKRHFPDTAFDPDFLDETIMANYSDEKAAAQLIATFSLLAVLIGGLGIFGLVAFIIESRSKELSIRKVLGASVGNLIILLSRKILRPVFFSILIAIPGSWYLMNRWLSNFAYRITIDSHIVIITLITLVFTLLVSVGFQTWRAAMVNPVEAIQDE